MGGGWLGGNHTNVGRQCRIGKRSAESAPRAGAAWPGQRRDERPHSELPLVRAFLEGNQWAHCVDVVFFTARHSPVQGAPWL